MTTKVINQGYIVAGSKTHGILGAEIQVFFENSQVFFIHNQKRYTTTIREGQIHCCLEGEKNLTKNTTHGDYRQILRYILHLPKNDLAIQYGLMSIQDLPLLFYVLPNGFLFKLDIEQDVITYAAINQGDQILLVKQLGDWQSNKGQSEVLSSGDNYYDILGLLYKEATELIKSILQNHPMLVN